MTTSLRQRQKKTRPNTSLCSLIERKMVFRVQDELRRCPSVTIFEEISDIGRIKTIRPSSRNVMKGSRKYRRNMYHVNNRESSWRRAGVKPKLRHCIDVSNNATNTATDSKRKQMVERVIGKAITSRTMLMEMTQKDKDKSSKTKVLGIKASQTSYKIEGLQTSSKFDKADKEAERRFGPGPSFQPPQKNVKDVTFASNKYGRKDSTRPYDAKLPMSSKKMSKELQLNRFTLGETVEENGSDKDLATIANVHLSQREQALKLLADIQLKMDKRQKSEDDIPQSRKGSRQITPEEALQCAWLRLSKAQIATLEFLIRQQGKDPGIHAHSDVTNYDVFAEIREIRCTIHLKKTSGAHFATFAEQVARPLDLDTKVPAFCFEDILTLSPTYG